MNTETRRYVPALGFKFLTPLYDPLVRLTTREVTFKNALLDTANVDDRAQVLDVGCGTGTELAAMYRKYDAEVVE